jgi:hypothetical protein
MNRRQNLDALRKAIVLSKSVPAIKPRNTPEGIVGAIPIV